MCTFFETHPISVRTSAHIPLNFSLRWGSHCTRLPAFSRAGEVRVTPQPPHHLSGQIIFFSYSSAHTLDSLTKVPPSVKSHCVSVSPRGRGQGHTATIVSSLWTDHLFLLFVRAHIEQFLKSPPVSQESLCQRFPTRERSGSHRNHRIISLDRSSFSPIHLRTRWTVSQKFTSVKSHCASISSQF